MNIIDINGDIAQWNMSASYLKYKLQQVSGDIEVHINSYGGDVFEGIAMYNMLREYSSNKGTVTTVNKSMCASIASLIFLAGDTRKAYENATIMIHRAWSWNVGNAEDMEAQAKILSGIDIVLANTYAKSMDLGRDEILDIMSKEGWYIGQESLAETNFIDEFIPDTNTRTTLASAQATYKKVVSEISAKAEKEGISHNFEEVKDSIMQCNDGKCPMDKPQDNVASMPSASDSGVKIEKNNQTGADMEFTQENFNILMESRQHLNENIKTLNAKLEESATALEAKNGEIDALKADIEAKLSEAENAKESAIEALKAEMETRVVEAIENGVDAEVAKAMIMAETSEEASKIIIDAKKSDGATSTEENLEADNSEDFNAKCSSMGITFIK